MTDIRCKLPIGIQTFSLIRKVVYCYFAALGVDLIPEDTTSHGRIDLTGRHRGRVWSIELKVNELSQPGRALEQLEARDYYRTRR